MIQNAIGSVLVNDTIIVRPGTYNESVSINKNLVLGSMFLINNDTTFINTTTINSFGMNGVTFSQTDSLCQLIGFTISGNYHGINIEDQSDQTSPVVKYCKIFENNGYGINADGGNLKISNCTISNNIEGGTMFRRGFKTVNNCIIRSNNKIGIDLYEETATITNTLIHSNGEEGIRLRYNYDLVFEQLHDYQKYFSWS